MLMLLLLKTLVTANRLMRKFQNIQQNREASQSKLDRVTTIYSSYNLEINVDKTKCTAEYNKNSN